MDEIGFDKTGIDEIGFDKTGCDKTEPDFFSGVLGATFVSIPFCGLTFWIELILWEETTIGFVAIVALG